MDIEEIEAPALPGALLTSTEVDAALDVRTGTVEVVDKEMFSPTDRLAMAMKGSSTGQFMKHILGVYEGNVVYVPSNEVSLEVNVRVIIDQVHGGQLRADGMTVCGARFRRA